MADAPKRVLVTGAAGFIGRALVERFRELGSEVRGIDLVESEEEWHLAADLTEPGDWQDHAQGCDLVVHTAGWSASTAPPRATGRRLGMDGARTAPARVVREVARAMDLAARVRGRKSEATPAAIDYFMRRGSYSIGRARELLGYQPAHDLEAGMRKTEAWLRAEGLL